MVTGSEFMALPQALVTVTDTVPAASAPQLTLTLVVPCPEEIDAPADTDQL